MNRYVVTPYVYDDANQPSSWSVWDREEKRWVTDAPAGLWGKAAACAALMNGEKLEIVREDLSRFIDARVKERYYLIKEPIMSGFCIEFETREAAEEFVAKYSPKSKVPV